MLLSLSTRSSLARSARSYAHQAAAPLTITANQAATAQTVLTTPADNKLTASISVFIKAGSRYQPSHGLAHLLKNSVFKSTQKRSALSLVRETELLGGILTSSLTREHLILSAEFLKGNEGYFAEVLGDVISCSKFTRHEFHEEALPGAQAEYEQAQTDGSIVALEQAHQVAFRQGLGNPLLMDPKMGGSQEMMEEYGRQSFGRAREQTIVGTGIEGGRLTELVEQFFGSSSGEEGSGGSGGSGKTSYHGGEARIARGEDGSRGRMVIGFKGTTAPEYTVLQHLLGSEPGSIKWAAGSGPLAALPVRAFNLAYSDIALFGFLVSAPANQTRSVAQNALRQLRQIATGNTVDHEAVKRAALKAQFLVASHLENNLLRTELLGTQALGSPKSASQLTDLYSSYAQVTADQVVKAAKDLLDSPPTTVAVGNTQELPYFDQLEF
ncbi:ubiquinol-cytochrome c reductase core subunit 1 [Puccinia graminis f. sp. tritici]|uniref:Cytochrome b-c1 complex subunit 2, mitochondrial n=1 Tax=Puccinia graminis f. sp. tritici TaxID=56615 RepID=A0A5B0QPC0_PUCGR|nr:ubiquinol-cytochrome c reductase core subunit 1 [Puccinia graminis f. sp. tritici]